MNTYYMSVRLPVTYTYEVAAETLEAALENARDAASRCDWVVDADGMDQAPLDRLLDEVCYVKDDEVNDVDTTESANALWATLNDLPEQHQVKRPIWMRMDGYFDPDGDLRRFTTSSEFYEVKEDVYEGLLAARKKDISDVLAELVQRCPQAVDLAERLRGLFDFRYVLIAAMDAMASAPEPKK